MGTGSGAMAGSAVLFLVLCSLPYMHAECCHKKIVSGVAAEDKGLVGTYTLLDDVSDDKNVACFDGCVYAREGRQGEEYCFPAVAGAQTTPLSSDELRQQAEEAAAEVTVNNAI